MPRNEAETRAELIDPQLVEQGWTGQHCQIHREHTIRAGRILPGGRREYTKPADYVLSFKGRKIAVIEAKAEDAYYTKGVGQAKEYAQKLETKYTYSTNGKKIYQINMNSGEEKDVERFPTPQELWDKTFNDRSDEEIKVIQTPSNDCAGQYQPRYYSENAINRASEAIVKGQKRILLTMATGTGKTLISFQIAWKLFQISWSLQGIGAKRPRILFLVDRNILADQAYNAFHHFPENSLVRIKPQSIRKEGRVPTNGHVFFSIFQTFVTKDGEDFNFGQYPRDYFDLIIVDECHRGGANDQSNWRGILEYFEPAVQLGLTATPKRDENVDTYDYFGEPLAVYSLIEGINDGFLSPFKVNQVDSTMDEYVFNPSDDVIEGEEEFEKDKLYTKNEFNRLLEIKDREKTRVKQFMDVMHKDEKTLVFCATQRHALIIRDLINQYMSDKGLARDPMYCVRVTADDGELGEQYLREFQDNEKTIPTILTTSRKLSTGVDALNIRNIVLLRPIHNIIEFKQIIGRGSRLYEGKEYFTIHDFEEAYQHFADDEWDGEPLEPDDISKPDKPEGKPDDFDDGGDGGREKKRTLIEIELGDGRARQIEYSSQTLYYDQQGRPISAEEFIKNIFGALPDLFQDENELRTLWSSPDTRKKLLDGLASRGFGEAALKEIQKMTNNEYSDVYDVLSYIAYAKEPKLREERVAMAKESVEVILTDKELEFINFILSKYEVDGVWELGAEKLSSLVRLKYGTPIAAQQILGEAREIKELFTNFQKYLYLQPAQS